MDSENWKEADLVIDIESDKNIMLNKEEVISDRLEKYDETLNWEMNFSTSPNTCHDNRETLDNRLLRGDKLGLLEKAVGFEKPRKKSSEKPPRPPRPPKSHSLGAADQKLIQEISELSLSKRARLERMKARKKIKIAKASSSSSSTNCGALVVTVLFLLIIIWKGIVHFVISFQKCMQK